MNLYDLGEEFYTTVQRINDRIEQGDTFDSPEDQDELKRALGLEGEWKEKALNFARYVISEKAKIKVIDEEIDRLNKLKKRHQNPINYFQQVMQSQMIEYGVDVIEDEIVKIRVQDNAVYSVSIKNESLLPAKYKSEEVVVKIDKRALLKDREILIEQGVEGVEYKKGKHLRIV